VVEERVRIQERKLKDIYLEIAKEIRKINLLLKDQAQMINDVELMNAIMRKKFNKPRGRK